MSDWGEQAAIQESGAPASNGAKTQTLAANVAATHSTQNAPSVQANAQTSGQSANDFWASGPLSKPFFQAGSGGWDVAATEQEEDLSRLSISKSPHPASTAGRGREGANQAAANEEKQTVRDTHPTNCASRDPRTAKAAPSQPIISSETAPAAGPASQPKQPEESEQAPSIAEQSFLNKVLRQKLVDSSQPIEVQRSDPNNPLHSVKTFEELPLSPLILKGIYNMQFNRPSKIQETALPLLLANPPRNLIAQSQSGTGKTAAFILALVSRINPEQQCPQAIVLAPTLELALQIGDVCKTMTKFCPAIKVIFAVRGQRAPQRVEEQIVIGTPGTVIDWLVKRRCFDPKAVTVFVLDEADVMISQQGHQDQSTRVKKTLVNPALQVMLFSATYDTEVMRFAERIVSDPVVIKLKKEDESLDNIRQMYTECRNESEKYEALSNIYGIISVGQAIVFCHSRKSATWLAQKMHADGHAVAILTGEFDTDQRVAVLNRFRQGKERVLITTNVCSRGIDVDQVSVVINYDIPYDVVRQQPDYETYLHRIGRTGRFGKSGLAVNFVDGFRSQRNLKAIEEHFGKTIERLDKDGTELLSELM